ncbi:hypothetical protein BH11MYX4_BH11MYX4_39890 [soil metagenome]
MATSAAGHRKLLVLLACSSAWFGCTKFTSEAADTPIAEAGAGDDASDAGASDGSTAAPPFLLDTFTRTQATGWGLADIGGPWRVTGTASVAGGVGRMVPAIGTGVYVFSDAVAAGDIDLQVVVTSSAIGNKSDAGLALGSGLFVSLIGRAAAGNSSNYAAAVIVENGGTVGFGLSSRVNGVDTSLSRVSAERTVAAGEALRIRFQIVGTRPTRLRGKTWKTSEPEPAAWTAEVEDSAAPLQQAGGIALSTYLSSKSAVPVTATFDEVTARPLP